jgi:hypothetical protein
LQFAAKGHGDVRFVDSSVPPREDKDKGGITKTIYYAKAGRGETIAKLDLELVPTQASGKNLFCCFLTRRSRRLSGRLSDRKPLVTDDRGRVTLPMPWAGRYVLSHLLRRETRQQR